MRISLSPLLAARRRRLFAQVNMRLVCGHRTACCSLALDLALLLNDAKDAKDGRQWRRFRRCQTDSTLSIVARTHTNHWISLRMQKHSEFVLLGLSFAALLRSICCVSESIFIARARTQIDNNFAFLSCVCARSLCLSGANRKCERAFSGVRPISFARASVRSVLFRSFSVCEI